MNSLNPYNDFPDVSEFLDSEPLPEPLHLSEQGNADADLDDFDFILEDEDGGHLLFADSKGSSGFDCILAAMECQGEMLESSLNHMQIEAIQENEEAHYVPSYRPRRSQRDRSPNPQAKQRFRASDEVDFDPPARDISFVQQHQRQTSHSDLSTCSYATAQSSSSAARQYSNKTQYDESQYGEALKNLAESMKRSDESRRVVAMMRRRMLSPEQRRALSAEKERLREESQRVAAQQESSIVANLFSGSYGGMLTNGLEQGRKQLGLYMSQVNNQTL